MATCPDPAVRNGLEAVKLASKFFDRNVTAECQLWEPAIALAEAYAETGNFTDAVSLAKRSIDLAGPDFGRRWELLEKLSLFEKKMPYRMNETKQP